jgi:salicylate hydroxylase
MPPQGEGVGMVLEDVVLLALITGRYGATGLKNVFTLYEDLRRKRIDVAYDEANFRWETVKDSGWLAQAMKEWLTPVFLWWSAKARRATFEEDLTLWK